MDDNQRVEPFLYASIPTFESFLYDYIGSRYELTQRRGDIFSMLPCELVAYILSFLRIQDVSAARIGTEYRLGYVADQYIEAAFVAARFKEKPIYGTSGHFRDMHDKLRPHDKCYHGSAECKGLGWHHCDEPFIREPFIREPSVPVTYDEMLKRRYYYSVPDRLRDYQRQVFDKLMTREPAESFVYNEVGAGAIQVRPTIDDEVYHLHRPIHAGQLYAPLSTYTTMRDIYRDESSIDVPQRDRWYMLFDDIDDAKLDEAMKAHLNAKKMSSAEDE